MIILDNFRRYGYDGIWNLSVLGSVSKSSPLWEYGRVSSFGMRCRRFSAVWRAFATNGKW